MGTNKQATRAGVTDGVDAESQRKETRERRRFILLAFLMVDVLAVCFVVGYWFIVRGNGGAGQQVAGDVATAPGNNGVAAGPAVVPVVTVPPVRAVTAAGLHGGIGMGTWDTTAEFKDIMVTGSDGKTLLKADFANGMEGWQTPVGQWQGAAGLLTQESRAINVKAMTGDTNWADYTYSLKARRTDGTEGFLIMYAVQGPTTFTWWNIGGWANTRTAIEQAANGSRRELPGTAVVLTVDTGTWYDIKIELRGGVASLYFDGKLITTVEGGVGQSTMPDAGRPLLGNNGNGVVPYK